MAIKDCDCKHEYQDKMYGKGKRVHTPMKAGNKEGKYRCTVCAKTKN